MNLTKIINLVSTGLFTLLILFSAGMYFFSHEDVVIAFENLGFPTILFIH
jgi:hypothetical protein